MIVNITLSVGSNDQFLELRDELNNYYEVSSIKILPDTQEMYAKDPVFQSMIKSKKKINTEIGKYINDNNQKYKNIGEAENLSE